MARKIYFYSLKGGVGATTCAVGVGMALARAGERALILDGDNKLWFLEINTLPGMTPTSLAPQEAAAAGMDYEQLCQALIDLAFKDTEVRI